MYASRWLLHHHGHVGSTCWQRNCVITLLPLSAWCSVPHNARLRTMDAAMASRTRQDELWTSHARETLKRILDALPASDAAAAAAAALHKPRKDTKPATHVSNV